MVKKLRKTGELGDRYRYSGRKAKILPQDRERLGALIAAQPDLTLGEIKERLNMTCSVPALHYASAAVGLTSKKDAPCRRAGPSRCCGVPPELATGAERLRAA